MGVKYIYAMTTSSTWDNSTDNALTSQDLTSMSGEWITQLYQAALEVNSGQVMELIAQIPRTKLARQFQWEPILDFA